MTIFEKLATTNNTTPEEIRAEIQLAIDAAWNDPAAAEFRQTVFPTGKPTPEQFIAALAQLAH